MKLKRGNNRVTNQVIKKTKTVNRYRICNFIALELESKFKYDTFNYQSKRIGLETTEQILKTIDTYLYKYKDNEPDNKK